MKALNISLMVLVAFFPLNVLSVNKDFQVIFTEDVEVNLAGGEVQVIEQPGTQLSFIYDESSLSPNCMPRIHKNMEEVVFSVFGSECSIDLKIIKPPRAELDIETISANVTLTGVTGDVDITTLSGDIKATKVNASSLDLESNSGRIQVQDSKVSDISIQVVNAPATIVGTFAEVEVETVQAPVNIFFTDFAGGSPVEFTAQSGSGDINVYVPQGTGSYLMFRSVRGQASPQKLSSTMPDIILEVETYEGNFNLIESIEVSQIA